MIDEQERRSKPTCLELIARQQPMAADLRLISMVLKMITDIERIADHSSDISEITLRLGQEEPIKPLVDIPQMAEAARDMVHRAIRAFVDNDMDMALEVCRRDDEVDRLFEKVIVDLSTMMKAEPGRRGQGDRPHLHREIPGTRRRPRHEHRRMGGLQHHGQAQAPDARQ